MKVVLILLLLFAGWLYTYKLETVPAGLYVDEAVTGYNAYSIGLTGKDENGQSWPVLFRFFGSYSPPLYTYLTVPIIKLAGLRVISVRVMSVMAGLIAIWLMWQWLCALPLKWKGSVWMGTLLLILAPWHLLFARTGYEVYLGAMMWWISCWCWWLSKRNSKWVVVSLAVLSLSTYGAHAERYLAPLTLMVFLLIDYRSVWSNPGRRFLVTGLVLAALIQIPHLTVIRTPAFWAKQQLAYTQSLQPAAVKLPEWLPKQVVFTIAGIREPLGRWMTYYSQGSLFFWPDPDPQRSMPELSTYFVWMIIPYLLGWYGWWRWRKSRESKLLVGLILVAPLPAALTADPFSTQRALPLFFLLNILMTIGLDQALGFLRLKWRWIIMVTVLAWSGANLWRSYFVLLPLERAEAWNSGLTQLAQALQAYPGDQVVIDPSRQKPIYIQLAFWLRMPPEEVQAATDLRSLDQYYRQIEFRPERRLKNFEIRTINWETDSYRRQILVGDSLAISDEQATEHALSQLFVIKDPLGKVLFQVYQTDPVRKCQNKKDLNPLCSTWRSSL